MALHTYARVGGGFCINVEVWDSASVPGGLVQIDTLNPEPGPGWSYAGGTSFAPPAVSQSQLNYQTISANVASNQALIQQFIAANPGGAVLTGPQTIILAKMLNGLCNLLLQQYSTVANT